MLFHIMFVFQFGCCGADQGFGDYALYSIAADLNEHSVCEMQNFGKVFFHELNIGYNTNFVMQRYKISHPKHFNPLSQLSALPQLNITPVKISTCSHRYFVFILNMLFETML